MSFYADFPDRIENFRTVSQLRNVLVKIQRDEERLFAMSDGPEKEHCKTYLGLSRKAVLLKALIEAEGRPSVRRSLSRELNSNALSQLPELAPEQDRERVEHIFRAIGYTNPAAAFVSHGVQLVMAAGAVGLLIFGGSAIMAAVGGLLLVAIFAWAGIEFWRALQARRQAREIYAMLLENVRMRLKVMRRMHEEIPLYY